MITTKKKNRQTNGNRIRKELEADDRLTDILERAHIPMEELTPPSGTFDTQYLAGFARGLLYAGRGRLKLEPKEEAALEVDLPDEEEDEAPATVREMVEAILKEKPGLTSREIAEAGEEMFGIDLNLRTVRTELSPSKSGDAFKRKEKDGVMRYRLG